MGDIVAILKVGNRHTPYRENIDKVSEKLESAPYEISAENDNYGNLIPVIRDYEWGELHEPFSMKEWDVATKYIYDFFENGYKLKQMGFLMKLAILLEGKQGSGKTTYMKWIGKLLIKDKNAIFFSIKDAQTFQIAWELIKDLRKIHDNPFVIMFDECEMLMKEREEFMKQVLDGSDSIDNCLFLFATNYATKIPNTIMERPSRLRHIIKVNGISSKKEIKTTLMKLINKPKCDVDFSALNIEDEVNKLFDNDCTVDDIKQLVSDYIITGKILPAAKLQRNGRKIGFGVGNEEE